MSSKVYCVHCALELQSVLQPHDCMAEYNKQLRMYSDLQEEYSSDVGKVSELYKSLEHELQEVERLQS